jgi:NodT family efflux transporter outer membrane factor (OMF) lipoprotein
MIRVSQPGLAFLTGLWMSSGFWMLSGCAVGPNYTSPDLPTPPAWAEIDPSIETTEHPEWEMWWDQFDDPMLTSLIKEADANNRNLMVAVSRINEYRARYGIASADLYPDIELATDYSRNRVSDTDYSQAGFGVSHPFNNWSVGLDASWEIDLFGRIARTIESAQAEWEGMIEDWRDVMITLRADVATSYINIRTLQGRRKVTLENIKSSEHLVTLTHHKEQSGTSSMLEVYQAQAQFYAFKAQLPTIETQLVEEIGNLAVLLGRTQGGLAQSLGEKVGIPVPPAEVAVGIPADIIRRRPDLRSAERTLAAATATIGVAEAQLYPSVTLGGRFALSAAHFSDLWQWSSRSYAAGPSISWDFFNGGRLRAQVEQAESQTKQALLSYEQDVLSALAEVESALAGFALSAQQRDLLTSGVKAARSAIDLATLQYQAGTLDFLTVLDAQQQVLVLEDELVQARGLTAETLVELYRSLGGGWTPGVVPPTPEDEDDITIASVDKEAA